MQFYLDDMTCGGCVGSVTKIIQNLDAKAQVEAEPSTHLVNITTSVDKEKIVAALTDAGFPPRQD